MMFRYLFLCRKLKTLERIRKWHITEKEAWIMTMGGSFENKKYCHDKAMYHLDQANKLESQIKLLT